MGLRLYGIPSRISYAPSSWRKHMNRCLWITALVVTLSGCSSSTPSETSNTETGPAVTGTASTETPRAEESGPGEVSVQPGDSPETLLSSYETAYNSGSVATIETLVHWGEADESQQAVTRRFLCRNAGDSRVLKHQLMESETFGDPDQHFTGTQTHSVELTLGTDSSSNAFDWPIGKVGDEYRFLAWLRED